MIEEPLVDYSTTEGRLKLAEASIRTLSEGARRAAEGLADHEARLGRVESCIRGLRNVRRLEERER